MQHLTDCVRYTGSCSQFLYNPAGISPEDLFGRREIVKRYLNERQIADCGAQTFFREDD